MGYGEIDSRRNLVWPDRGQPQPRRVPHVLLAISSGWPDGEPGAPALDAALAARGLDAQWKCWDDAAVGWAAADLVAVRSTWDYMERHEEFVAWARRIAGRTRLLNGPDVFAWNVDKSYLTGLGGRLAVVPTRTAATLEELAAGVREFGVAVVKPRVGAAGAGVLVVDDPTDPRLGAEVKDHPELPPGRGPWVVQPFVPSVRTEGETSVFVLGGVPVSQVDKLADRRRGPRPRALRGVVPGGAAPRRGG